MPQTNIIKRIINRMRSLRRRIRDEKQGVDTKKQEIILSSAYFDQEDYIKNYPEVADFPAGACAHFFLHGISENKQARFFDAKWYVANHPDVALSKYDAYGHYKESIETERRSARFITINTRINKGITQSYRDWIKEFDSSDSKLHSSVKKECALANDLPPLSILFKMTPQYEDFAQIEKFLSSIVNSYYKNFELVLAITDTSSQSLINLIQNYQNIIKIKIINYKIEDSENIIYSLLLENANYEAILKCDILAELSPTLLYFCAKNHNNNQSYLTYFDHDYYDGNLIRCNYQFKPDFNYDLFLANNYIGTIWASNKKSFAAVLKKIDGKYDFDYSYILEFIKAFKQEKIRHIPIIGFHYPIGINPQNSPMAIQNFLNSMGYNAIVKENIEVPNTNRIEYLLGGQMPKVSIIIPTRDKLEILKNCVTSIIDKTTYNNYEIIIVDNGSIYPETLEFFKTIQKNENIRVITLDVEFNYSKLNNYAAAKATGEYICLMNNDIGIISANWIEEMLATAMQDGVGCVGARLWYPNDTIQHAGVFVGFYGVAGHWNRLLGKGAKSYMNRASLQQTVSAVTAAVLMVKKSIYEEVGGLEEKLAVAFNDIDFCLKIRDKGYRNIYTPFVEMYHYESASRGKDITEAQKTREKQEIDFMKDKYGDALVNCPQYNPNLSLESEDFELAFPPREFII